MTARFRARVHPVLRWLGNFTLPSTFKKMTRTVGIMDARNTVLEEIRPFIGVRKCGGGVGVALLQIVRRKKNRSKTK